MFTACWSSDGRHVKEIEDAYMEHLRTTSMYRRQMRNTRSSQNHHMTFLQITTTGGQTDSHIHNGGWELP
jgi:hypothetical protein